MKKEKRAADPAFTDQTNFQNILEEMSEEEKALLTVMEGFGRLLDEAFPEGMTFDEVVAVQRAVNTFLMDFLQDMHEAEVGELLHRGSGN
ncbi:MAG: hypothetical protein QW520_03615 [Methanomassiliicoccales archaeon]